MLFVAVELIRHAGALSERLRRGHATAMPP